MSADSKQAWRKADPARARKRDSEMRARWRKANPERAREINEGKKRKRKDRKPLSAIISQFWW